VNVPIGIVGTLGTLALLPRDPRGAPARLVATFLSGYRTALLTCAGIAAVAIVTSLLRGRELRGS
jgi:hypothetical protein